MGIIILPFLLGALIIGVVSLIKTIKIVRKKQIGLKEIILGLTTSILIFGMICLSYKLEGKAWGLSPAFRLPIFMTFIPFVIHISIEKSHNSKLVYISKIILISVTLSTLLGVIFNNLFFELIDYLGIEKYY